MPATKEIRSTTLHTRHPNLTTTMQEPTTIQLRTAMEVLQKLGERINNHATRSLRQIPPSSVAGLASLSLVRTITVTSSLFHTHALPLILRQVLRLAKISRIVAHSLARLKTTHPARHLAKYFAAANALPTCLLRRLPTLLRSQYGRLIPRSTNGKVPCAKSKTSRATLGTLLNFPAGRADRR